MDIFFRCPSHCSALHKLRLGGALAAVVLAEGYVVDPLHDAADHRAVVPVNVSDGGVTPNEAAVGVGADQ